LKIILLIIIVFTLALMQVLQLNKAHCAMSVKVKVISLRVWFAVDFCFLLGACRNRQLHPCCVQVVEAAELFDFS